MDQSLNYLVVKIIHFYYLTITLMIFKVKIYINLKLIITIIKLMIIEIKIPTFMYDNFLLY